MMKNYLLKLLAQCSEENFGQDAIEWAIGSGLVRLTYDFDRDIQQTMSRYDEIIEAYRSSLAQPKQRAPMERAMPGRRAKSAEATSTGKRKRAA